MAKRKKFYWGSVVTGIGLGLVVAFWATIMIPKIYPNFMYNLVLLYLLSIVTFALMGYYASKTTEIIAYALSAFIIFQFSWDSVVEPVLGPVRVGLFWRALILLIINSFTGHYGDKKARTIVLRGLGVK
jgi:hypothetical protein